VLVVVHIVGLEEAGVVRCCDYVSEHSSAESDVCTAYSFVGSVSRRYERRLTSSFDSNYLLASSPRGCGFALGTWSTGQSARSIVRLD
jgi:hypothetical protein